MVGRVGMILVLGLSWASVAQAQVGAQDLRERVLDRQRTMWRLQMNLAFQSMVQTPFVPAPVWAAQHMQYMYLQQLQQSGYLVPPVPLVPPPGGAAPVSPLGATAEERRLLREAERLNFREAPGARSLELARLALPHNPDLARQFLLQAIREAGENSAIAQIARQELRKLDMP